MAADRGPDQSDLRPLLAITLGDVAGIGPEILVRAWGQPRLRESCRAIVIGSAEVLRAVALHWRPELTVEIVAEPPTMEYDPWAIPCVDVGAPNLSGLEPGRAHAAAGRAAIAFLHRAIDLALNHSVDGIVTLPINKHGLHLAGLGNAGHTEILAQRAGIRTFAMMLYRQGLGVVHVTLHVRLRDVAGLITHKAVLEKTRLLDTMLRRLGTSRPRLAVAGLNPHASDGGVFGDEEAAIILPAVEQARADGIAVVGPLSADSLFVRAARGEFDGVVAMYHDQGHIAVKLLGWREAVNITLGLPFVRTSVAHGTGYDIVGQGRADPSNLLEAAAVAARLCVAGDPIACPTRA
jgi:4-hydroxythreonine-4-phosphate dehydrogenase